MHILQINVLEPGFPRKIGLETAQKQPQLYMHWFAVKVYNKFMSCPGEHDKIFAQKVVNILKSDYRSSDCVNNSEPLYTALLARVLDRYLYPDNDDGCCLHQPPLKTDSRPDFFVSALHDDALHEVPSLVADFKLKEFHKAENESVQYCRHVLSKLCVVTPILIKQLGFN